MLVPRSATSICSTLRTGGPAGGRRRPGCDDGHVISLGVVRIGIDPDVHLGPLPVHWYGVMYALAFLAGFQVGVLPHLLPRGVSRADCDRMVIWVIVAGLLGARLYYDV